PAPGRNRSGGRAFWGSSGSTLGMGNRRRPGLGAAGSVTHVLRAVAAQDLDAASAGAGRARRGALDRLGGRAVELGQAVARISAVGPRLERLDLRGAQSVARRHDGLARQEQVAIRQYL